MTSNNNKYSIPNISKAKKRESSEVKTINFEITDELKKIGENKFYLVKTYGCQMNTYDTETIVGILELMKFKETKDENNADVIIINTCAIRESAEDKVFGEIGRLKHLKFEKPDLVIGIAGCMSQEENVINKILKSYSNVDLIFGTHNIHRLPFLLKDVISKKETTIEVWSKEGDIIEQLPKYRKDGLKAWVNIMYGCDKFCTYCIVPYTRGMERSRRPKDIIMEVTELAEQGYMEVTLLGQNVNAYGKDLKLNYDFGDLLNDLRKIHIPRIRFTTSHPSDFDDHLIEVLSKKGNLVEHIHLPIQSGNTEILKKMARKYTREHYLNLVSKIKTAIPDVVLTTDIIVGFPGETEEQFLDTLSIIKNVQFDFAYTFIYSPREGTPAAKMIDDISEKVKKERLQCLMDLQNEISRSINEKLIGTVYEVLVEGVSKKNPYFLTGRTRTNKSVNFAGNKDLIGKLVDVRITEGLTWSLNGEIV
ncbi:MAG: tRNA (N6-isopentenyl adenosine(37)-C2)-methylthiotransferase MiaB [Vulcanibacillus sp.]